MWLKFERAALSWRSRSVLANVEHLEDHRRHYREIRRQKLESVIFEEGRPRLACTPPWRTFVGM